MSTTELNRPFRIEFVFLRLLTRVGQKQSHGAKLARAKPRFKLWRQKNLRPSAPSLYFRGVHHEDRESGPDCARWSVEVNTCLGWLSTPPPPRESVPSRPKPARKRRSLSLSLSIAGSTRTIRSMSLSLSAFQLIFSTLTAFN